jgi:hypothetical protein
MISEPRLLSCPTLASTSFSTTILVHIPKLDQPIHTCIDWIRGEKDCRCLEKSRGPVDVGRCGGSHVRHPNVQDTADDRNIVELIIPRLMRINSWLRSFWEL